jgi:hypothetical protein
MMRMTLFCVFCARALWPLRASTAMQLAANTRRTGEKRVAEANIKFFVMMIFLW